MSENGASSYLGSSWITVTGNPRSDLVSLISARLNSKIAVGEFSANDLNYLAKMRLLPIDGALSLPPLRLEKLRRLCQLWDVDFKPKEITSHRPIIGHFIVAVKKLTIPILRILLKDTLRQQRDFNAAVIALLTDLANKAE